MPSKKAAAKPAPDWMDRIKESSHDVFLAGLASLVRARQSGAKKDKADFETLVAEGRKLEPEMKESVQKTLSEWREKSRGPFEFKRDGKLQEVFEERVAAVLGRLGVPSAKEIADLNAKVDRLLAGGKAPVARKKAPAAKPAAKAPSKPVRKPARKAAKKSATAK
jgi:poly(hydroxyalkanoate) granule-associated protein